MRTHTHRTRGTIIKELQCLLKNERRRADRLQQKLNDRTKPRLVDAEAMDEEREQIYNEHYRKECRRLINWVHHDTARIQLLHSAFAGQIPIQFQDLEVRHGITTRNIALDSSGVLDTPSKSRRMNTEQQGKRGKDGKL